jgi:hypothetical protein
MPACADTHRTSSVSQGPGPCCRAIASSGQAPRVGLRVAATDARGRCIVCEVKASTSKKNPGAMVIKRGKSMGLCPTSAHGCCALLA